jgi:hypothetical protein
MPEANASRFRLIWAVTSLIASTAGWRLVLGGVLHGVSHDDLRLSRVTTVAFVALLASGCVSGIVGLTRGKVSAGLSILGLLVNAFVLLMAIVIVNTH